MTIVWKPKHPEKTRMWEFIQYLNQRHKKELRQYDELHSWSKDNPALFWQSLSDFFKVAWSTPPHHIVQYGKDFLDTKWFEGASFNFAEKLLNHDKLEKTALVSVREDGKTVRLTRKELKRKVASCQNALKKMGVTEGMRVAAVLPNTEEAIIAMLATASLGAIWGSCSPDFGIEATIDRLAQIEPTVLFICDGHCYRGKTYSGLQKIKEMAKQIPSLQQIVIVPTIDLDIPNDEIDASFFDDFLKEKIDEPTFKPFPFNHPLYIMFSSGTTGKPKCIVHGQGGTLLQHIKELGLHTDIRSEDNLCFYTTIGWMMWNWMVSALFFDATLTLYEGSPVFPSSLRLFELIEKEHISVFGTSARFISETEKSGEKPAHHFPMSSLKTILSTGSPLLPQHYDFVYQEIKSDVQLSSISGGTDILSCFALGNPMLPIYRGEIQSLGLGMAVSIFNEKGQTMTHGMGELVCTKPFPSMPISFWNDPQNKAYHRAYFEHFPHVWAHGDFAEITAHQGLIIYGRSDATLNPGGVRIGTAEIYRQVEKVPDVLESVVIGQHFKDDIRIILFVKMRPNVHLDEAMRDRIRNTIRMNASPRHVPQKILEVEDIPRTLNGKIVELAVRQTVHGESVGNLGSLMNPEALQYFKDRNELK